MKYARPNLIDRAIAIFAPGAAYHRMQYRTAMGLAARNFEGASVGRRTKDWNAASTGPNTELIPAIRRLRDRARDLSRNDPWGRKAVRVIKTSVVGGGIRARIRPLREGVDPEPMRQAWKAWAETTECDADGRQNFYGMQGLVMRSVAESGETLVRRRRRRSRDGLTVPIQLQSLEADHLDARRDFFDAQGNKVLQGIQFDSLSRRTGYWLFPYHPGEYLRGPVSFVSNLIPAEDVAHVYDVERSGQVRGIPFAVSVLIKLRDLNEYDDATLMKAKIANLWGGFVQDSQLAQSPDPDTLNDPSPIDTLEPGTIEHLPPGKTITFPTPPRTNDYGPFMTAQLRAVASGYGISYEALTGDFSQVNFGSGRMGWIEMGKNVQDWQFLMMIPLFLDPTWKWFQDAAFMAGIPGALDVACSWTPPRREMINPTEEVVAMRNAIRSGLTTLPEAARELGWDFEELVEEAESGWKKVDEAGLILDSDPRNTNGQGQREDPNGPTPADPAAAGASGKKPAPVAAKADPDDEPDE